MDSFWYMAKIKINIVYFWLMQKFIGLYELLMAC